MSMERCPHPFPSSANHKQHSMETRGYRMMSSCENHFFVWRNINVIAFYHFLKSKNQKVRFCSVRCADMVRPHPTTTKPR